MSVDVRRSSSRFVTRTPWLVSQHSFSFGPHYDPANLGFGLLEVVNEDVLAPASGYAAHPHRGLEIVTWVLSGTLLHEDSAGSRVEVGPGAVQHLSARGGVVHSEHNACPDRPLHLVQTWLRSTATAGPPSYAGRDVAALLEPDRLVPVLGGPDGLLPLDGADAVLRVGRLPAAAAVTLPDGPAVHLFVARGSVRLGGTAGDGAAAPGRDTALGPGDAVRLRAAGPRRLTAEEPAEVLVWQLGG